MGAHKYRKLDEGNLASEDDIALQDGVTSKTAFLHESNGDTTKESGADDYRGLDSSSRRKPSIYWLMPFFTISSLAFGITAVPRMNLLVSLVCRQTLLQVQDMPTSSVAPRHGGSMGSSMGDTASNSTMGNSTEVVVGGYNPQCTTSEIESATALVTTWGNLIVGIIGAVMSSYLGRLSDRYGRVRLIAVNSIGLLLAECLLVVFASFPDVFSVSWMYLTFAVDGFCGSFVLLMALVSSYATDCTSEQDRNVALGWIHGSMFFGMAAGPALSSALSAWGGQQKPLMSYYYSLAMRVASVLYLALVPESLSRARLRSSKEHSEGRQRSSLFSRDRKTSWLSRIKSANPVQTLKDFLPVGPDSSRALRINMVVLMAVNVIIYGGAVGTMEVMLLYPQMAFKWGNAESGVFLSIINIFRAVASVLVLPLLVRIFRKRAPSPSSSSPPVRTGATALDITLIRLATLFDVFGFIFYALSPSGSLFTLSGALASFGAVGLATTEATLTKHVPLARTGELLGALSFLQALMRVVAPTTISLVYSLTVESNVPQAVFWGVAGGLAIAGGLSLVVKEGIKPPEEALGDETPTKDGGGSCGC
ncbi:MAG: Hippocampus abundant transcript 1 protein [Caeruleum heppii]|nr:MAG: Hippocampus abundant transcript 1 protein [Caeruleum heppii]